jgi:predicted nucleotidyltransferase
VVTLAAVQAALRADPDVSLAAAFGSAARGVASPSSDLDIGVAGVPLSRLPALAVSLSRLADCEVDLIQLETAPPLLRFEIARDGVLLVERSKGLWPAFQARAMVDWWEWAPSARRFVAAAMNRLSSRRP